MQYLQTNDKGYVVGVTNEQLLGGLFGGTSRNCKELTDEQATTIQFLLETRHKSGEGLHSNELEKMLSLEKQ